MTLKWEEILLEVILRFGCGPGIDADDEAVLAVLMVLHSTVVERRDLNDLAILCIEYDESFADRVRP
jgi:hypothetical protein